MQTYGNNLLPTDASKWTFNNGVTMPTAGQLSMPVDGSASTTLTSINNTNILPESFMVSVTSSMPIDTSLAGLDSTGLNIDLVIIRADGTTCFSSVTAVAIDSETFIAIVNPRESGDSDVYAFNSITLSIYNAYTSAVTISELALKKSLDDSLIDDTVYYGVKINTATGLSVTRTDGKAEAIFNADTFVMRAKVDNVMTDKLYFDVTNNTYVFDGELSARTITALSSMFTPNLYAEKATIADLTVDQLDTSDKIQNYLNNDRTDVRYIKIFNQTIQFMVAMTDGTQTVQATDRNNNPLYWANTEHKSASKTVTDYPVMQFVYTDYVKSEITFEEDSGSYEPRIRLGYGSGTGDNGRAYIWKSTTGLTLRYVIDASNETNLTISDFVDAKMRRIKSVAISKSTGTINVTMEGQINAQVVHYTETDTSMTFIWPDNYSAIVSIS